MIVSSLSFSQIGVNKQYHETDTTRTFTLVEVNEDECIKKYIMAWGAPDKNSVGNLFWEDILIPEVGSNVNIRIIDGIGTRLPDMFKVVSFVDEKDKKQRLENLKSNQLRITDIIIKDKSDINFVNSDILESNIKSYLISLLE